MPAIASVPIASLHFVLMRSSRGHGVTRWTSKTTPRSRRNLRDGGSVMRVHERQQLRETGVVAGVIEQPDLNAVQLAREIEDAEREPVLRALHLVERAH